MTWAAIGSEERDGLNVALNEATWIGIRVDAETRRAAVLLDVLSLPVEGPAPVSAPVVVAVDRVSRIAASLRNGWWNDTAAEVVAVELADLDATVRSFGGCPIYGWECIDPPEESWAHWCERLSLDLTFAEQTSPHVLELFQEGGSAAPRHFDLRVWFDRIGISTPDGRHLPLVDFIAAGVRWWDEMYAGDPRTSGRGIVPLRND
jgi:hypothetical protein